MNLSKVSPSTSIRKVVAVNSLGKEFADRYV